MKIKQQPEDFEVEELTDVQPGDSGDYALYRLDKTGWTTHDALDALRRRWDLERYRVSYGGLKDRHARTSQYVSIYHGPKRGLTHHTVHVTYLGQIAEAFSSEHISGNRFRLVMRALHDADIARAEKALVEIRSDGVPNYFDDQRFGSISPHPRPLSPEGRGEQTRATGDQFMAKALMQGRFEEALRLCLTSYYEHDRAPQKKEKATLRQHWGDWRVCKERLPRGHARSLVDYLTHHPDDFKGAVLRLRPDLRSLYLSAFQSFLWNRALARWLERALRPEQLAPLHLRVGEYPAHCHLEPAQRDALFGLQIPMPSAQIKLEENDPRRQIIDEIIRDEQLEWDQFRLKGMKNVFFSKGERAALFLPKDLTWEAGGDELHAGRKKLSLGFILPRGCYATIVVKRLSG